MAKRNTDWNDSGRGVHLRENYYAKRNRELEAQQKQAELDAATRAFQQKEAAAFLMQKVQDLDARAPIQSIEDLREVRRKRMEEKDGPERNADLYNLIQDSYDKAKELKRGSDSGR
jgi:hypothetical protein